MIASATKTGTASSWKTTLVVESCQCDQGFSEGHENNINFIKKVTFTMSHFQGFFKESVKTPYYNTQNTRDTKKKSN